MAESNKRKIAEPIYLNDEDPFAELTRIMGFDPRFTAREQPANEPGPAAEVAASRPAPARPIAIEPGPAPAAHAISHDDFGIDLEKELMGEFADFEPAPLSALPPDQPAAALQPDDGLDMALDDDFGDAFAAGLDGEVVPVDAAAADEPAPVAASQIADPYDDVTLDEGFAIDPELDLAPELDLVPELEFDDLDLSEPHLDDVPAEPEPLVVPVVPTRVEASAVSQPGALAEVDMDFSTAFNEASRTDDEVQDVEQASPAADLSYKHANRSPEPSAADADALALSIEEELSALLDDDHAAPAVPSLVASVAPVPTGSRGSAVPIDPDGQAADTIAAPAAPASEHRRPFIDPSIVGRLASFKAAPVPQAAAPQAAPAPEDDLDDLLDAMAGEVQTDDHAPAEARHDDVYTAPPAMENAETAYAHDDAVPADQSYDDYGDQRAAGHDPAPDIETIDVPETAVAIADDLEIPELSYEQDEPAASYDDLDADYHRAFAEPAAVDGPVLHSKKATEELDFEAEFESLYRSTAAFETNVHVTPSANSYTPAQIASADYGNARMSALDEYGDTASASPAGRDRFVDLDFDGDVEEEIALPGNTATVHDAHTAPRRRGLLIAAVVGGAALLGGVGALALSFGNGDGADVPVVVKADSGPVKVKPENPGGTSVPNQDNKVYDAVKGTDGAGAAPAQERLVTTSEEPVDMANVATSNDLPGVTDEDMIVPKAEDRIDPAANTDDAAAESIAVAPRKVKTMVVRADGTLAPREDPAPIAPTEAASAETAPGATDTTAEAHPLQPAVQPANDETGDDQTGAVTSDQSSGPALRSPDVDPVAVPVKSVKTNTITTADPTASVPETGPAVEARPAEQPVDVVGEVKPEPVAPEQVAAANVEPVAIANGSWSVQIASQPSAESAKSTYQDLAKRYGGVIGGRGVNIVKADIAGKGTYWRVRVPAQSRDDAIKLCTDYKSAGGNCFVSK